MGRHFMPGSSFLFEFAAFIRLDIYNGDRHLYINGDRHDNCLQPHVYGPPRWVCGTGSNEERAAIISEYVVRHYEHVTTKSFEELVAAFEQAVGDGDDGRFLNGM